MSGQRPETGNSGEGYNPDRYRGRRNVVADVPGGGTERGDHYRIRNAAPGPGGRVSVSAAQQRWPEYNRRVVLATAIGGTAVLLAAAVIEAVVR